MKNEGFIEGGLKEMEEILNQAEVGRLALSEGASPYIVPLNFFYEKGKIIFHCAWEGKKIDIIGRSPQCCFEVDKFMGEVSYHSDVLCHLDYDSVLAFGEARIEHDKEKKLHFFQSLEEKYVEIYRKPLSEGGKRFQEASLSEACCVVMDITELTGRRERTMDKECQKTLWHYQF